MHRLLTMKRLSVLFLSIFAVLLAGMFAYENLVIAPGDRCEEGGKWWDPRGRVCAQPVSIAEITGRPNPGERAAASAEKNRELVAIEDSLAAQQKARDADADRQRAALAAQ
ncbi:MULTISPECIES: hypothetical protein [unclassified Brevundimonas]|uniref:hypothetical protein n=1 Tax=unclassified Brevundimonas TaxID=2622653 RepID=UPI0006F36648|nr:MULTISPECIES: hypothetical protein [unclassified Brevundimonas]KQY62745.1 hypothetical protein ASD25_28905 [Brevundimonas sp. Root1423]KRA28347.1 hypothetical protein ASD59_00480 [Brevundimonas sp. Root608]